MTSLTDAATGVGGVPVEMSKSIKKREKIREKKRAHQKRKQQQKSTLARVNSSTANGAAAEGSDKKKERPGAKRGESSLSKLSKIEEPEEDLGLELAHEAGAGFRKTGGAIARFPMNLSLALTQGFHNAPRLYGDETVRRPPRVTGFHSGLRAGRDELVYGVMDGVSGLVTQPIRGAKQKGVIGAARGVGFGIGGFVLKDIAAIMGPGAYLLKGLDAEYMKRYQPTNYLRRARIAQGQKELQLLESQARVARIDEAKAGQDKPVEKRDVIEQKVSARWQALQRAMEEEKKHHKPGVVGSLLGRGDKKEGQRMPRKSRDDTDRSHVQPNGTTIPHAKTEKQVTKEKQSMDREGQKMRLDGGNRGLNRSSTAPITTLEHRGTNDIKPLGRPSVEQKPRTSNIEEKREEDMVGNVHLTDGAKNHSDEHVDQTTDQAATSPTNLSVEDVKNEIRRPSADTRPSTDTNSDTTRVDSDVHDWAAVRKQAEGVEGGRPLDLSARV
jgi:hypothetical protein